MSSRQLSLNDLKDQYIGKQFNWLTIVDVYRNEELSKWFVVCQCKCGKTINRQINKVTSGRLKSCGCFVKSDEFADKRRSWCANNTDKIRTLVGEVLKQRIKLLNSQYVGKTYNWLTILEVFPVFYDNGRLKRYDAKCKCKCGKDTITRIVYITSGHTKSCGCYNSSEEHKAALSKFWKDNPDKAKERAEKRSEWCKNNPDKVAEQGKRHSQWYKDNPDRVKESVEKYKRWCKENPDKLAEQGRTHSQYFKDNPDVLKVAGKKISQWYKDNPDKVKEKFEAQSKRYIDNPELRQQASDRARQFYADNPDLRKQITDSYRQYMLEKRIESIDLLQNSSQQNEFSRLIDIIHPDYINKLLSGEVSSNTLIKTKCPLCGTYSEHLFGSTFILKRGTFKYGRPLLCKTCRNDKIIASSKAEQEISDYISTFYDGECIRNSRNIIFPLELDLYYPEKKIAIEFNGDYWHSEKFKEKDYHYNKFKECINKNIILVSIFERHWNSDRDAIKHYISDLFNGINNELSFNEDHSFMNNNYPLPTTNKAYKTVDDYYSFSKSNIRVYTCGLSTINY